MQILEHIAQSIHQRDIPLFGSYPSLENSLVLLYELLNPVTFPEVFEETVTRKQFHSILLLF